jgi:hypothetical protein
MSARSAGTRSSVTCRILSNHYRGSAQPSVIAKNEKRGIQKMFEEQAYALLKSRQHVDPELADMLGQESDYALDPRNVEISEFPDLPCGESRKYRRDFETGQLLEELCGLERADAQKAAASAPATKPAPTAPELQILAARALLKDVRLRPNKHEQFKGNRAMHALETRAWGQSDIAENDDLYCEVRYWG